MALDSKHPLYAASFADWNLMEHASKGEGAIKDEGITYLPATQGMVEDGMGANQAGLARYGRYKARAVFHDLVDEAVRSFVGVMHQKPPVIALPRALEPLRGRATVHNESLEVLLRRINEAQLIQGRIGLLLDVDAAGLPYIAPYRAQSILNWDDGARDELLKQKLNFVALDESEFERGVDFEWAFACKYRILILGAATENEPRGLYRVGLFEGAAAGLDEAALIAPSIMGRTLEEIPFVFINSRDLVPRPDRPPLIGLARLALAIYRGEADYRQSLHVQGQDTLFVRGASSDQQSDMRLGAGVVNFLPEEGGADFVGIDSAGLPEQRQAIENDLRKAESMGGKLLAQNGREAESGEALKVRVAAQTATLNQIARTAAFGLESLLKTAATWVGADPAEVSVAPNLDFANDELTARSLHDLMAAKDLGAPLSLQSIHRILAQKDLTAMSFEEELTRIAAEQGGTTPDSATLPAHLSK